MITIYLYYMEYRCEICDKEYISKSGLWKHSKKHMVNDVTVSVINKSTFGKIVCKYCKKEFKSRQSRWRHEKGCSNKNKLEEKIENIEIKLKKLNIVKPEYILTLLDNEIKILNSAFGIGFTYYKKLTEIILENYKLIFENNIDNINLNKIKIIKENIRNIKKMVTERFDHKYYLKNLVLLNEVPVKKVVNNQKKYKYSNNYNNNLTDSNTSDSYSSDSSYQSSII